MVEFSLLAPGPWLLLCATATARLSMTANQSVVHLHIVACHPARCEALLENFPATCTAEIRNAPNCFDRVLQFFDNEACSPFFYHFGNCSTLVRDHWSPAGYCLDHYEAEWLRPVNGEQ